MIILKFGGSSVGNAERMRNVAHIIQKARDRTPIVVVSAVQGVTDILIDTAQSALQGKLNFIKTNLQRFHDIHKEIIEKNCLNNTSGRVKSILQKYIEELERLFRGVLCLRELSSRTKDLIASYGERMSSHLLTETLRALGEDVQRFSAVDLVATDDQFGSATVDFPKTKRNFQKKIFPIVKNRYIPVITGFIGRSHSGDITILGRGGSDYSASIAAISLSAKEIQIWTDVDGIMTTDPKLLPNAKIVPSVSFQEASELAYFGAKVLHPKTIQPAIEQNIPVRILNTFNLKSQGTLITSEKTNHNVKAIAFRKNISLINICSSRMLGQYGFLAQTFSLFEKYHVSVDVIATSEVSISLTIDDKDFNEQLLCDLQKISTVRVLKDQVIICIVGNGLKDDIQTESRIFSLLAKEGIPTEMISKGASQLNLTMIIHKKYLESAITVLHNGLIF